MELSRTKIKSVEQDVSSDQQGLFPTCDDRHRQCKDTLDAGLGDMPHRDPTSLPLPCNVHKAKEKPVKCAT
jgi:hypothetical protein